MRWLNSISPRTAPLSESQRAQESTLRRTRFRGASGLAVILATVLMLIAPANLYAKKYKSVATGNWGALATWNQSVNGGVTWVAATAAPGAAVGDTVQVNLGHTVTI